MVIIKIKIVALLIIFSICTGIGQYKVTFEENVFYINDEPFFPIGWYECNNIKELKELKSTGVNTVLVLWDFFVQSNGKDFSANGYRNSLKPFLSVADTLDVKVIIQIPYKKQFSSASEFESAITNDDYIDIIVSYFKDSRAVLGWYLADEPEAVSNWKTQPYARLQAWYKLIKEIDKHHPVFVCMANGNDLLSQTIDRKNASKINHNPYTENKFFDVLMEDHYVIKMENSVPSTSLHDYDEWLKTLFKAFIKFNNEDLKAYSTMLVTQGYGGGIEGYRNPAMSEIKYSVFSAIEFAQSSKYRSDFLYNLGGILFWRYGAANYDCKRDINEFINFFVKYSFDEIIRQENINDLILNQHLVPEVGVFLRFWEGSYYLFVINRSNKKIKCKLQLKIDSYSNSNELLVPFDKIKKVYLDDEECGIVSFNSALERRETKIIQINK